LDQESAQKSYTTQNYSTVDPTIDVETYNCYGLAMRTYEFIGDLHGEVIPTLKKQSIPELDAVPGDLKLTLWTYDLHLEDSKGTKLSPTSNDFHIVGGLVQESGDASTNVYSKNGRRPVFGPGKANEFKPLTAGPVETNDRQAIEQMDSFGKPLVKVRTNMEEHIFYIPTVKAP